MCGGGGGGGCRYGTLLGVEGKCGYPFGSCWAAEVPRERMEGRCEGKVWRMPGACVPPDPPLLSGMLAAYMPHCPSLLPPPSPSPLTLSGMLAAYVPSLEERKQLFEAVAYECQVGEESVDGQCVTNMCNICSEGVKMATKLRAKPYRHTPSSPAPPHRWLPSPRRPSSCTWPLIGRDRPWPS